MLLFLHKNQLERKNLIIILKLKKISTILKITVKVNIFVKNLKEVSEITQFILQVDVMIVRLVC